MFEDKIMYLFYFFILPSENEVMVLLFNKKREISFSFLEQEAFQPGANFVLVPPGIAMLIYSNFTLLEDLFVL